MSKCYDIDHELKDAIEEALVALMNTPEVDTKYKQQHQDAQKKAYERLKESYENTDVF